MNNVFTSYLLWCGCFFGFSGLHRIYNKKYISGIFWLCSLGVFGIGQLIDLTLIPDMVDEHNYKMRRKLGLSDQGIPLGAEVNPTLVKSKFKSTPVNQKLSQDELMIKLAKAAYRKGGKLSVTQAVIETNISFEEVEKTLNLMLKKGYVMIDNDPKTGVVIYHFMEL